PRHDRGVPRDHGPVRVLPVRAGRAAWTSVRDPDLHDVLADGALAGNPGAMAADLGGARRARRRAGRGISLSPAAPGRVRDPIFPDERRPSQPAPSVTDDDVSRVVRRDYPAAEVDGILQIIAAVDVREKPRVVLACLKIANGIRWRPSGGHGT